MVDLFSGNRKQIRQEYLFDGCKFLSWATLFAFRENFTKRLGNLQIISVTLASGFAK
jgi:hypothetical protein